MGDGSESLHQAVRQGADQQGAVGIIPGFPFLRPAPGPVNADGHGPHIILHPLGSDEIRQRQPGLSLLVQLLALGQQDGLRNVSGFIRPDGDVVMAGRGIGRENADDAAGLVAVLLYGLFQQVAGVLVQGRGRLRLGRILRPEFLGGAVPGAVQFPGVEKGVQSMRSISSSTVT